jgi:hypothetical protein
MAREPVAVAERDPSTTEALRRNRFENVLGTIGRTPVIKLQRLAPAHVNLYVKVEAFNPMGSAKDPPASAARIQ